MSNVLRNRTHVEGNRVSPLDSIPRKTKVPSSPASVQMPQGASTPPLPKKTLPAKPSSSQLPATLRRTNSSDSNASTASTVLTVSDGEDETSRPSDSTLKPASKSFLPSKPALVKPSTKTVPTGRPGSVPARAHHPPNEPTTAFDVDAGRPVTAPPSAPQPPNKPAAAFDVDADRPVKASGTSNVPAPAKPASNVPAPSQPALPNCPVTAPGNSNVPAPAQPALPAPRPERPRPNVNRKALWGNEAVNRAHLQATASGSADPSADEDREDGGGKVIEGIVEERTRFAAYKSTLPYGVDHPDPLVEAASLAACAPPPLTYTPLLLTDPVGKRAINHGSISKIQLENIAYACQRHEKILPNGRERAGFFVGDGAGVGKGRSISGMVLENWLHGRKKALWFSISADLVVDAKRDLDDIGADFIPPHALNKMDYGRLDRAGAGHEGVVFSTYSSLIASKRGGTRANDSRLGQLVEWSGGEDFEGLLVFDESHKAKNLVPPSQGNGKKKNGMAKEENPTKTGLAVVEIQARLPKARVVYVSATGASEPRNMAYMQRLGLWGDKTSFPSFNAFNSAINQRGAGAMECVATDMKSMGMYFSRTLSYSEATFELCKFELDPAEIDYDGAAALVAELRKLFEGWVRSNTQALDGKQKAGLWRYYWGSFQRFFKYLCISVKVPKTIELAKEALEQGKSVIIGLQGTGEARTADKLEEEGEDFEELISSSRETLKGMIDYFALKCFDITDATRSRRRDNFVKSHKKGRGRRDSGDDSDESEDITISDDEEDEDDGEDAPMEIDSEDENGNVKLRKVKGKAFKVTKKREIFRRDPRTRRTRRTTAMYSREASSVSSDEDDDFQKPKSTFGRKLARAAKADSDDDDFMSEKAFFSDKHKKLARKRVVSDSDDDFQRPVKKAGHRDSDTEGEYEVEKEPKSEPINLDSDDEVLPTGPSLTATPALAPLSSIGSFQPASAMSRPGPVDIDSVNVTSTATILAQMREWKSKIDLLRLPNNPLDTLINALGGPKKVAEMTGRKIHAVADPDQPSVWRYEQRNGGVALDQVNISERNRFQDGRKLVAIISEAASAGISLQGSHRDRRVGNQRRRVHITIELPWSADKAIQQLGRSHRSNQSTAPEYKLVISNIGGEMRFASAVAKRLESLGALTKGDRRAATDGISLGQFNFETRWGRLAVEHVYSNLDGSMIHTDFKHAPEVLPDGMTVEQFYTATKRAFDMLDLADRGTDDGKVKKFLNRMLGIYPLPLQNSVFDYFALHLKLVLEWARRTNRLDAGIEDIGGKFETVSFAPNSGNTVFRDSFSGITTKHVELLADRGLSWDKAAEVYKGKDSTDLKAGYYMSKPLPGRETQYALALTHAGKAYYARMYKPNLGELETVELWEDLLRKYTKVSNPDTIKKAWTKKYQDSVEICSHAASSKEGKCGIQKTSGHCSVGKRVRSFHVLSGAVVPVWTRVENALASAGCNERIRIVRSTTTTNERVIGIQIPGKFIQDVLFALDEEMAEGEASSLYSDMDE